MNTTNLTGALSTSVLSLALFSGASEAALYDLSNLLSNPGFETGLTDWTYTGAGVNSDTYLTDAEWTAQSWSSSSPFYTDAQLATLYPGRPWGLNPDITHEQQSTATSGPTTTITAAVGSNFVGSRQDGYQGHCEAGGSFCGSETAYYDTNFQLTQGSIDNGGAGFLDGDELTLTVWAVRGRLNAGDWGVDNNSSELRARLTGGGINLNQSFTGWANDGIWASQTFSWTLTADAANLTLKLTGLNSNHDRFVAVDLGPVPVPAAVWLFGSGLLGLVGIARRRKIS
jgi:hypothetical protein